MQRYFSMFLVVLLCTACSSKELLPGEAEWNESILEAEAIVASGATDKTSCDRLKSLYSDAEVEFKALLPHLKGMGIRKRDMRMGVVKEYRDKDCRP